jgi:hypothetical protein
MRRHCGDCQLCCRLLPVPPLQKLAGEQCRFQKYHKGCTVYHTLAMPPECGLWNCRWLVNDDAAELSRPDRSHYVLDLMPDYITTVDNETGERRNIQVVQIWVDPNHRDAHRDPALRRWLERRAQDGIAAIVRYSATDALILFAPSFDVGGGDQWHEMTTGMRERSHTLDEVEAALDGKVRAVFGD